MKTRAAKPLRVLTWHIHGSYLYYLSQSDLELFVPIKAGKPARYGGKGNAFPWGPNVHEVGATRVKDLTIDCVLFQSRENYLQDQYDLLSEAQRSLPRAYLEHDPPREHPTDTKHVVQDPRVLVIHVTHFNDLMWHTLAPTRVIEHGVIVPDARYTGRRPRGAVVVNNLRSRGRRLGLDIFERVRREIPLDLFGMDAESLGGKGELSHQDLMREVAQYRFFFNPIRYTSMGLSVCEAMMIGVPIIALATTEMPVHAGNGAGFAHTDPNLLIKKMRSLIEDRKLAKRMSERARAAARKSFSIERFAKEWETTLRTWVQKSNRMTAKGNNVDQGRHVPAKASRDVSSRAISQAGGQRGGAAPAGADSDRGTTQPASEIV